MRRPLVALVAALAVIGTFTGGLAWLLSDPRAPAGASRGERLYYRYCAECHGVNGRGSWRAALFLLRPGDLTDSGRMRQHSDKYLFDVIKHGGAPIGRPGMPAFGAQLSDADTEEVVRHVRMLSGGRPTGRVAAPLTSASRSTPP